MSLNILAEALARIEFKLDSLLTHQQVKFHQPMQFSDARCPVCRERINYQVDVSSQLVVRRCDCKTGKVPSTIPLLPVLPQQGIPNVQVPQVSVDPEPVGGSSNSSRGKAR